jgi:hypothetical protein
MVFHRGFPVAEGVKGDAEESWVLEFKANAEALFAVVATEVWKMIVSKYFL